MVKNFPVTILLCIVILVALKACGGQENDGGLSAEQDGSMDQGENNIFIVNIELCTVDRGISSELQI